MPRIIEGEVEGRGKRVALVVSRFNEFVTGRLLRGALRALHAHGVASEDTLVCWVPGAFEIPAAARAVAEKKLAQAIVCLGAVIRGETPHFDYVARAATDGIAAVGLETGVPAIFGILTTDTAEQALARAAEGADAHPFDNKGYEAALVALEMIGILAKL